MKKAIVQVRSATIKKNLVDLEFLNGVSRIILAWQLGENLPICWTTWPC